MKEKEFGALVGAGVCGLFAGLLVASGGFKRKFPHTDVLFKPKLLVQ